MTERSRLVLPNGQKAMPEAPKVISTTLDADGNKLIYDEDSGATLVFGKNGCVGFADARGVTMRTSIDGAVEFVCTKVRFISEAPPEFLQLKTNNPEEEQNP